MVEQKTEESQEQEVKQLVEMVEEVEKFAGARKAIQDITLSDGRIAYVREAKGRDLEKGAAVAQNPTNPLSLFMGVVAQVTKVDGQPLIYEALLDLPMSDVMALIGAVGGNGLTPSQLSAISS